MRLTEITRFKSLPSAVNQNNYPNGGFTGEQITKYPGNADLAIVKFSPNDKIKILVKLLHQPL